MNWSSKINNVESILESWRKRDLSLFGRIQILKTFALSQFVLPATLLVVPPDENQGKLKAYCIHFCGEAKIE